MERCKIVIGKYELFLDEEPPYAIVRYDATASGHMEKQFETRVDDCAGKTRHAILRQAWLAIEDDLKAWAEAHAPMGPPPPN